MPEQQTPTPFRRFVAKQTPLTASMLNQAIDHANANRSVTGGRGILVRRVASGYIIELAGTAQVNASPITAVRMYVDTIENDYLICRKVSDGVPGGESIYVAKPRQLRHDVVYYGGLTTWTTTDAQTVDVSDGSTTETWAVNLPYFVGCEIDAYEPTGGTGLTITGLVGIEEPVVVTWVDNTTRKWAVVL